MKIGKWLKDVFDAEEFNDIPLSQIGEAFNDSEVRTKWLFDLLDEVKRINLEVEKRLLTQNEYGLIDLCARRKAIQDVFMMVLSAKRQVAQGVRHNPRPVSVVDLDRVTA